MGRSEGLHPSLGYIVPLGMGGIAILALKGRLPSMMGCESHP
jgi:hypothetical protein